MGIKTHYGPIDSVRWRKSFYTQYSYKQNLFQNATAFPILYIGNMSICGYRLGFFHTALNILIPPVISGIPTQSYPRKPWKRGQFTFQEPRGLTFSGSMCEGSGRSFQFNVWAQETQEKGKACPPGAFRGKMTHTGRERSQDKKSHLSLLCAGTRTEHSITGWREGADLFASSRTWQGAGVMYGTAWAVHVPRRMVEMSLQLAHFPPRHRGGWWVHWGSLGTPNGPQGLLAATSGKHNSGYLCCLKQTP